jgi:hypothetical protein
LRNGLDLFDEEVKVNVFLGILIEELCVFATNFSDIDLLHVVESFNDLGDLFRTFDNNDGPFVANSGHKGDSWLGLEGSGRGSFDKGCLAFDHVDFDIVEPSVDTLNDGDRDERVENLIDEGAGLEFSEIVFIEFFGAEVLVDGRRFGMDLTTVPNKLNCMFFTVEFVK